MSLIDDPWRFLLAMTALAVALAAWVSCTTNWNRYTNRLKRIMPSLVVFFFLFAWSAGQASTEHLEFKIRVVLLIVSLLVVFVMFVWPDKGNDRYDG